MKKLLVFVGGGLLILLLTIAVIPMVYDVNAKIRPKIEQAIETHLNAKSEIGKLGLSLWGGIFITIDTFKLLDLQKKVVFEMSDAKLAIPIRSLLGGTPSVSLIVENPTLNVEKTRGGVLNVSTLMKSKEAGAASVSESSETPTSGATGSGAKSAEKLRFSTEIRNAKIFYKELAGGQTAQVERLTLITKDISVNRPFKIEMLANLNYSKPPEVKVEGDIRITGDVEIKVGDQGFKSADLKSSVDLSGLFLKYGSLFNKKTGVPLNFEADLTASANELEMRNVQAQVNDFKLALSGTVKNFEQPDLDIKLKSNKLDLEAWRPILALASDYEMSGQVGFDLGLTGRLENLRYSGSLSMRDLGMKVPGIVPRATNLTGELRFKNEEVQLEKTSIKLGASDLTFNGSVKNFSAPQIGVVVSSKLFDLDQLLPEKPKAEAPAKAESKPPVAATDAETDQKVESMAKGPIDAIKKNPILKKMVFKSTTKIAKLVISKAQITDFVAQVDFVDLVLSLSNASMNAFSGSIQSKANIDFKAAEPSYNISGNVKDLEINSAVVSQFPDLADFISGRTFANLSVSGSGVAPSKVKSNLRGNGNFEIKGGRWSGLSPLKMIGEKLQSLPGAKDKIGNVVVGNKFRQLKSQFEIRDSKLILKDAVADLEEARTTLTAQGHIGFDKNMKVEGTILTPVNNPPSRINNGDGRAKIPYEIAGAVNSPSTNWGATLGPVGQAYLEEEGKKVLKKGLEKVQESIKNDKIKDLLKGINF